MILIASLLIAAAGILVAVRAHRAGVRERDRADRYATLVANLPDVTVMVYDRERRLTLMEGSLLEQNGWRRDELLGRPLAAIVPAERHGELLPHCDAALRGEGSGQEWEALRGGARYRLEHVPLRDGALIVLRDITEPTRLQRVADAERGFLEAVLDQLSDGVVACDAEGRLRVGDVAGVGLGPLDWPAHFRLRRADGRTPLTPAEVPLFRALNGERVEAEALLSEDANGSLRHLIVTARPVADARGRLLGAVGTGVDVTERREAEERLRAGEERLRSVVESVGDIVFQTDLRGRWTFLNERFSDWTGIPVDAAIGRSVADVVHPGDRATHARAFAPLISGQVEEVRHRHRYVTAEGMTRWADVRARLARDADGLPHGAAGVIEDVTAGHRSQQYDAAEQAIVDVLMRAENLETGVAALLECLCHHLDWDLAELWTYDADAEALICTDAAGERRDGLEALEAARAGRALEIGDGLPGQAWARRTPIWVSTLHDEPLFCRGPEAFAAGVSSALAVPIARGGEVLAAILFLGREQREPDPGLNRLLGAVGAHLAQFLERRRVERELGERTAQLSELSRLTWAVLGR